MKVVLFILVLFFSGPAFSANSDKTYDDVVYRLNSIYAEDDDNNKYLLRMDKNVMDSSFHIKGHWHLYYSRAEGYHIQVILDNGESFIKPVKIAIETTDDEFGVGQTVDYSLVNTLTFEVEGQKSFITGELMIPEDGRSLALYPEGQTKLIELSLLEIPIESVEFTTHKPVENQGEFPVMEITLNDMSKQRIYFDGKNEIDVKKGAEYLSSIRPSGDHQHTYWQDWNFRDWR